MNRFLILSAAALAASPVTAQIIHNEAVDGDLSDDNLAPTFLAVSAGSNTVTGSTTGNPNLDRDIFTIEVAAGFELAAVILTTYDTTEDQSFFAVEAGNQITATFSPDALLGSALVGAEIGGSQGDDVLDDLGFAIFGGSGFTGTLGPGAYTFWFQETAAPVNYAFTFVIRVVPTPGVAATLGLAGLFAARRRR